MKTPIPIILKTVCSTSGGRFTEAQKCVAVIYKQADTWYELLRCPLGQDLIALYEMKPHPCRQTCMRYVYAQKRHVEDCDDTALGLYYEVEDVVQKSV